MENSSATKNGHLYTQDAAGCRVIHEDSTSESSLTCIANSGIQNVNAKAPLPVGMQIYVKLCLGVQSQFS